MGFVNNLENKVKDYLDGNYAVTETKSIPNVENVAFGKKALKMKLCAYCIDLRKSSDLLASHQKQTSGKIHKAFLTVAASVVEDRGGHIRSFQGDSLLAFWPASTKDQINTAVKAAMVTKWFLDIKLSPLFEQYEKIDFGIGVDWGEVFIVRTGISRNANNNDLVFIGDCVNFATRMANKARGPRHVEISSVTHHNLTDEMKYATKQGQRENMWKDSTTRYRGEDRSTKTTTWYWLM